MATKPVAIGIDINEANVSQRVGSNQYAFEIIKAIEAIDQTNRYTLYSRQPKLTDLPAPRKNWRYQLLTPSSLWTQWRLPLELFKGPRPDVFYSPGHYAPRFSPVPGVITIMDLAFLFFPQFYKSKDTIKLKNWTKYSVKKATRIIAISENTKKDIIKHYRVPAGKITLAYPGYDAVLYQPASLKHQIVACNKYHLKTPYILYVGTLQPRKNLVQLIEAFENLAATNPQITLAITGKKGWLYQDLVAKINHSPYQSRIKLTGFIDTIDLPAIYSAAECSVLPGLYEGFGIPAIEAIACGTIPVVSHTGSLPETVGDEGILVNPYEVDSISLGLKKALQLSRGGKHQKLKKLMTYIKKFNWHTSAKIILEVLHDVALHR